MKQDFDHIAESYDQSFTHTSIGQLQRQRVWKFLVPYLHQDQAVLELNCGTGYDANRLTKYVRNVLATDISSEMIAKAKHTYDQQDRLRFEILDANHIETLDQSFDLVFSNFGGLNCLSPEQWSAFSNLLDEKLTENGHFVAVIMGRNCVWEQRYFKLKKRPDEAIRRQSKQPVYAQVEEKKVPTWYYNPKEIRFFLAETFEQVEVRPIGLFIPPSYLEPYFSKKKLFLKGLHFSERISRAPQRWSSKADHYFIVFKKKTR